MITVVVPTFNSAASINRTLESIVNQSKAVEKLIVVDGGSRDHTVEMARKFLRPCDEIISEADRGPYDAMNKGVMRSSSEVVAILNSDDFWKPGTVQTVSSVFSKYPDVEMVHGDMDYVSSGSPTIRCRPAHGIHRWLGLGLPSVHPAAFFRRSLYERIGYYNFESFPMAADQDFVYRSLRSGLKEKYLDQALSVMASGGLSCLQDPTREIDCLIQSFPLHQRVPAQAVRYLLNHDNEFYNRNVRFDFLKEIWRRQFALRPWRRHSSNVVKMIGLR